MLSCSPACGCEVLTKINDDLFVNLPSTLPPADRPVPDQMVEAVDALLLILVHDVQGSGRLTTASTFGGCCSRFHVFKVMVLWITKGSNRVLTTKALTSKTNLASQRSNVLLAIQVPAVLAAARKLQTYSVQMVINALPMHRTFIFLSSCIRGYDSSLPRVSLNIIQTKVFSFYPHLFHKNSHNPPLHQLSDARSIRTTVPTGPFLRSRARA